MTNQEIADFIAEKVMEWTRNPYGDWCSKGTIQVVRGHWHPATDLNQAVQAAEKMRKTDPNGFWTVGYWQNDSWLGAVLAERVISTLGPADALARAVVKAAGGDDA